MSRREPTRAALSVRVALIAVATAAMVALVVALGQRQGRRVGGPPHAPVTALAPPARPIAAEAWVFRTRPEGLALPADAKRRRAAHPRTLATYRAIRAYPGAPPRVPHGLTAGEFRGARCATCHERGGYSQRFGAYAPVAPHPELEGCLQCHAPDDAVVGVSLPGRGADDVCRQCHAPAAARAPAPAADWRAAAWPRPVGRTPEGGPPPIPHDLQLRGNCLACHAGPSAVAEIRTTHPERADCRQCHVPVDAGAGEFVRTSAVAPAAGGAR
jgi:cytochrome c-type protein NapB